MPQASYDLSELKDWRVYENNLQAFGRSYIRKYCASLFKKWVHLLPNPFIVNWLENVYLNNGQWLLQFDQITLKTEQESLGETLLRDCIQELEDRNYTDSFKLLQEIQSFFGELHSARGLIRLGKRPKKIKAIGDFETDEEICSVKTVLGMDFNYEAIGSILRSGLYLRGNEILKKYNQFHLRNRKGIDDHFKSDVAKYISNKLVDDVMSSDSNLGNRKTLSRTERFEDMEVQVISYRNGKNHVDITFRDVREEKDGYLEMNFEEDTSFPWVYGPHEDTDTWWVTTLGQDGKFREELGGKIKSKVGKLNENFISHNQSGSKRKRFIGWINIGTHVQHDDYKKESEKMQTFLKSAIGDQPFDIYVYYGYDWWEYNESRLFFFKAD